MDKKELLEGNVAVSMAALRAGCQFFAGYPITPQTTITEYLAVELPRWGGCFVQAESEVAAINMIAGAAAGGMRVMTATSGPGLSLMAEGMSYMAGAGLPGVIIDVQRSGAGGGNLLASQSDYNYTTKTLGHGGLRAFTVGPESVQEAVDWTYKGFDLAEKYRSLFILLTDGMNGQMMEPVEIPEANKDIHPREYIVSGKRGRERRILKEFEFDVYTLEKKYKKYAAMYEQWAENETVWEDYEMEGAEYVVAAWGSAARITKTAIDSLKEQGLPVGMIRPITLHPFPRTPFLQLDPSRVKKLITVEMADPPQFFYDVELVNAGRIPHDYFTRSGGVIPTPDEIEAVILETIQSR